MNVQAKPPAPPDAAETDSITARMAAAHVFPEPGTRHVRRFEQLRAVLRNDGTLVFASRPERPLVTSTEPQEVVMRAPDLRLLAGEYEVAAYITDKSAAHFIDQRQGAARFKVSHQGLHKGIYLAETSWETPVGSRKDEKGG